VGNQYPNKKSEAMIKSFDRLVESFRVNYITTANDPYLEKLQESYCGLFHTL